MTWTKRDLVYQAFESIGMAHYAFDLSPEELQSALRQLDAMMGVWNNKGIRIGYPIPSTPANSNLDQESNLPDSANEAVYLNLSLRIAPSFGKSVQAELKQWAYSSYLSLLAQSAKPPFERQLPSTLPRGAGNKPWREKSQNFSSKPVDPLLAGEDDTLDFN